jgi:hypothetical protein
MSIALPSVSSLIEWIHNPTSIYSQFYQTSQSICKVTIVDTILNRKWLYNKSQVIIFNKIFYPSNIYKIYMHAQWNQCGLYCVEIYRYTLGRYFSFDSSLLQTWMSSRRDDHKIFIRNATEDSRLKIYLDALYTSILLLIGHMKNIRETEFHISLFLTSIPCVPRLLS